MINAQKNKAFSLWVSLVYLKQRPFGEGGGYKWLSGLRFWSRIAFDFPPTRNLKSQILYKQWWGGGGRGKVSCEEGKYLFPGFNWWLANFFAYFNNSIGSLRLFVCLHICWSALLIREPSTGDLFTRFDLILSQLTAHNLFTRSQTCDFSSSSRSGVIFAGK